jgi:hypothetical protein
MVERSLMPRAAVLNSSQHQLGELRHEQVITSLPNRYPHEAGAGPDALP